MASHGEVLVDQPAIGHRTLPVDEDNDLHILMGTTKSLSMIHVLPMHFVRVARTYSLERYLCLTDSLCGHTHRTPQHFACSW